MFHHYLFGFSSVKYPAMGADHPLSPDLECHMMISNGWRMPSSAEPRGKTESTAKDKLNSTQPEITDAGV